MGACSAQAQPVSTPFQASANAAAPPARRNHREPARAPRRRTRRSARATPPASFALDLSRGARTSHPTRRLRSVPRETAACPRPRNLGGVRDRILARHLATSVCSWSSSGYTRTRTPRSVGGYGRIVAMCRVGGADLNAWMVELGRAVAYRKCSRRYVSREASRRAERREVWREGVRSPPSRLRRAERLSGVPRSDSGECCARPVRVNRNYRP